MNRDPDPPLSRAWHALPPEEVLEELESSAGGLSESGAMDRARRWGTNELHATPAVSPLRLLADQFRGVVVALLVVAAVLAALLGDLPEAMAIAAVLLLNAGIGFVVEFRARRAMASLLNTSVSWTTVVRDGEPRRIATSGLVPGDVVLVEEGDAIPADARLLEEAELRVAEAPLTGEFAPVSKQVEAVGTDVPLAERSSMVFMGTGVASGRARAVVVATGVRTELGRVSEMVAGLPDRETPLEQRLDRLGRHLAVATVGVAGIVAGVGLLRGAPVRQMLETAVALAIAAVPEGLPAVATIALAVGLSRMARRQALVRELSAVEALGSTTVVCTDKTGTLTSGEMTVVRLAGLDWSARVSGVGYESEGTVTGDPGGGPHLETLLREITRSALLGSQATPDAETGRLLGDPTDAAILVLGRKGGWDRASLQASCPELRVVPFSSERPLTASVRQCDGDAVDVHVKGSPPAVLERCTAVLTPEGPVPLDGDREARLLALNQELAGEGLRVIALARGDDAAARGDPAELTFLGFAGISDPPAPGVPETIRALRGAGIRTVMITGDQAVTARAIAGALEMAGPDTAVLEGRELAGAGPEEMRRIAAGTSVFARTAPADKLRIVRGIQDAGGIVAMLGDGVNDAPALKQADVGVAMGRRGTDAARDTADIVLQDDRFPTVAAAVEEGRVIFDNIRKFVFYLFSCNLAEILVLLATGLAGLPLPLLPLQLLWLNLVTDTFPALALAMEPAEEDVMARPPREPDAAVLSRSFLGAMAFHAGMITLSTLAVFVWMHGRSTPAEANTAAFMTLALAQLFHLGTARAHHPVLAPRRIVANRWALGAVPLVLLLQGLALYLPVLQELLGTVVLDASTWMVVAPASILPAVVGQLLRLRRDRRQPSAVPGSLS